MQSHLCLFTWLVCDGDSSSRVASQLGALSWVTEIHEKLLDLFVLQEAIFLTQLQQMNRHSFLGLTRTISQVPFHSHIILQYTGRTGLEYRPAAELDCSHL